MRIALIPFIILLNTFLFAQEMPLVYDVENTGAGWPAPPMPTVSELPTINPLPDPFEWSDGRGRIQNFSDWKYRRNDIKAEIEHYEIGPKPDRPDTITASYSDNVLTINITVNGNTLTMTSNIVLPEGDGPFPAVIGMGGGTGSLPSSIFTDRNIAQVPFYYWQVMAWEQIRGSEPINALYPDLIYMGAYSAWSWGVSRLIDGLELVQDDLPIDLSHLAVTGCSFAGKMALFAGAFDERIALTIPQESGGGGSANWRFSETLDGVEKLANTSHRWFIEDLFLFSNYVSRLPYDHHELFAMVAPRAMFVIGNPSMVWLAEESGYVTCEAAQNIYNEFGVPDRFGYSFSPHGDHCVVPSVQIPEIETFVERFLLGNDTVNTDIATHSYTTDLAPWITWDTPSLADGTTFLEWSYLIYPANNQTQLDSAITFTWTQAEGAAKYYFQLSTSSSFNTLVVNDSLSDTTKIVTGLSLATQYYWRVRVKNSEGIFGPWSDQSYFATYITLPSKSQIVGFELLPRRSDRLDLTWTKSQFADDYLVQVSEEPDFSNIVLKSTSTDTSMTLQGTVEGQKYYWRVRGRNIGGVGPLSDLGNFTIIVAPRVLSLDRTGANEITLTWRDYSTIEDGYVIERKLNMDASFTIIDTLVGGEDATTYIDSTVEQGYTYTYRTKAYRDTLESGYSNEASLNVTGIESVKQQLPKEYSLSQNYPNPFNPSTKINFALPKGGLTKIIVYDILGRKILTLINKNVEAGYHDINFNAQNLPGGIYFYRIQSGDFMDTKRMLFIK